MVYKMDRRRHEKNKIQNDLRDLTVFNENDTLTISRLRSSGVNVEFNQKQIVKLLTRIEEREEKIAELKERLSKVISGELDKELQKQSENVIAEIRRKEDEKRARKNEIKAHKQADKEKSQAFYQANKDTFRETRKFAKDVSYGYRHFVKVCNSIPEYMLNELSRLPENHGYIWRGVHCYGKRPAEKGKPITLHENRKGKPMLIHEWTDKTYKIYEQTGKGKTKKRTLIETRPRKKFGGISTMADFI